MAFMGMMLGAIFLAIVIIIIILMLVFFILSAVLKRAAKKENKKKMRVAGNIFLVLGIIFAVPIVVLAGNIAFHSVYTKVPSMNGKTKYLRKSYISEMRSYAENPDESSIKKLENMLDKHRELALYHDVNYMSVLDFGLANGNADLVRISLEHGAKFDNPQRYYHISYIGNSMDYYLGCCASRTITEDDIEIVNMMFENNVSTVLQKEWGYYSNMFGKAAWAVLYNDKVITDTELEFIQLFVDQGISSDPKLLLREEVPSNHHFTSDTDENAANLTKDINYDKLMNIIGK